MLLEVNDEWNIVDETIQLGLALYCNSTELRFLEDKNMELK
jgi:predicted SAM-dependent methyltransferase